VNRPDPWTALHSTNLPARIRVPAVGDHAAPLPIRTCASGTALAFPLSSGRAS
jgi:hypothetical protein